MLEAAGREDQMTGTESMIRAAAAGGGQRLPAAIGEGQGGFFFFTCSSGRTALTLFVAQHYSCLDRSLWLEQRGKSEICAADLRGVSRKV